MVAFMELCAALSRPLQLFDPLSTNAQYEDQVQHKGFCFKTSHQAEGILKVTSPCHYILCNYRQPTQRLHLPMSLLAF